MTTEVPGHSAFPASGEWGLSVPHLLQLRSLEAVGLGCPRELVTQEIGARAPLAMGAPRGRPR
jgi:hypothetical protein